MELIGRQYNRADGIKLNDALHELSKKCIDYMHKHEKDTGYLGAI